MKYSVKITAVPDRMDMADNLAAMILRDAPDARLEILVDYERKGLGFNFFRAWRTELHDDDDFRFVIQEDTIVCRDFYATLGVAYTALLNLKGLSVPTFYANMKKQGAAIAKGRSWFPGADGDIWGQCIGGPLSFMQEYVTFCENPDNWALYETGSSKRNDGFSRFHGPRFSNEYSFNFFLRHKNVKIFISSKSLLQHIGRSRSTLGHTPGGHMGQSPWFIGDDVSGLSVDWSKI